MLLSFSFFCFAALTTGTEDPAATEGQRLNETEMTYVDGLQSPVKVFVPVDEANSHNNKDVSYDDDHSVDEGQYENNHTAKVVLKKHNHSKHSHHSHGHCHSGNDMKDTGIASIAWMVIMGDGMHNFSDGLAIGKYRLLLFLRTFHSITKLDSLHFFASDNTIAPCRYYHVYCKTSEN